MEDAPRLLRIAKSKCPCFGIRLPRRKWHKSWPKHWGLCGLERNLHGHPARSSSIGTWMGETTALGMSVCSSKTRIIASGLRGWYSKGSKKSEFESFVGEVDETGRSCRTNTLLDNVCLRCTNLTWMQTEWTFFGWRIYKDVLNHVFFLEQLKSYQDGRSLTQKQCRGPTTWNVMRKKCVERYCELAHKKTEQSYKVSTPCLDGHHFEGRTGISWRTVKNVLTNCLEMLVFGTSWYGSHNGQELVSLFKPAQHSRLCWFFDCFAGDLEDSKSTLVWILCFFGSRTFVPIIWIGCASSKRQCLTVPQNQKLFFRVLVCEWMEVPPLDLWDVATEVLHSSKNTHQAVGDRCWKEKVDDQVPEKSSAQ